VEEKRQRTRPPISNFRQKVFLSHVDLKPTCQPRQLRIPWSSGCNMAKNRLTRIALVRIPPAPAIASQPPICRLADLTPELHFEIFSYSEHVSSTYLGLTCKALCPIHRNLHGTVKLTAPKIAQIHPDGPSVTGTARRLVWSQEV
jgi:hypothetical protein